MLPNPQPKIEPALSNFIRKLVQLLSDQQTINIASWMPDGAGFTITNIDKFTADVLPSYYRHANMASFIRQLNMYGFHKIKQNEQSYYHHPFFLKEKPDLLYKITRKPQKKVTSESVVNTEKQNSVPSQKQPETPPTNRKNRKKVTFNENIPEKEIKSDQFFNASEIMSNVSIKFEQCEKNNQSLLVSGLSCQNILQYCDYDNFSDKPQEEDHIPRAGQFLNSTRKLILWEHPELNKDQDSFGDQ